MKLLSPFLLFGSGFACANNLGILLSINPEYEASWFKVAFCILLAAIGLLMSQDTEKGTGLADNLEEY